MLGINLQEVKIFSSVTIAIFPKFLPKVYIGKNVTNFYELSYQHDSIYITIGKSCFPANLLFVDSMKFML